jgi:hypothetical protein
MALLTHPIALVSRPQPGAFREGKCQREYAGTGEYFDSAGEWGRVEGDMGFPLRSRRHCPSGTGRGNIPGMLWR